MFASLFLVSAAASGNCAAGQAEILHCDVGSGEEKGKGLESG